MIRGHQTKILEKKPKSCQFLSIVYELQDAMLKNKTKKKIKYTIIAAPKTEGNNSDSMQLLKLKSTIWNNTAEECSHSIHLTKSIKTDYIQV